MIQNTQPNHIMPVLPLVLGYLFFVPSPVFADTAISVPSSAFASVGETDWAHAWIDYLFRGVALPAGLSTGSASFAPLADGLRQALGLYSLGMLLVAALLVFFHIAGMIAETAHSGVVFGRRANQVWMPIRFVLAIGLLVPVSGSLNAGQYLVLKTADEGSALASNAWRMIASAETGHLSGLVPPRGPDVAKLTAATVEIEACQLIYQQTYAQNQDDPVIRIAGNIGDLVKIPASRFVNETWRSSNTLNAAAPLCGEIRFSGYRRPGFLPSPVTDAAATTASELSNFAHEQATDLVAQAHIVATRAVPVFFGTVALAAADIQNDLATIDDLYRKRLETEWETINAAGGQIAAPALQDAVDAGWIDAARFLLELARLQETAGEVFNHALPTAQEPVFAHPLIARQALVEALDSMPSFHPLDQEGFGKLATFYSQVSRVMAQVHSWVYGSEIPEKDFIPPSSFDLRDRLTAATEPDAIFSMYAQALDAAALERGVWGESSDNSDAGYPLAPVAATNTYNPFAIIVEFGQRQVDVAFTIFALASGGLSSAGTVGPALLFGMAGLGLLLGGFLLVFVTPFLPFLRFLMSILAWAVNMFEAVVAIPIVALAHLTPSGEGLSGGLARQSYVLWLGLFVRPLLTLFGLMLGLLLFTLGLAFLTAVLSPFARLASPSNEGLFIIANLGLVLLYDVLVYAMANASFKGIHWLPEQSLRWISSFTVTDSSGISVTGASGTPGPSGLPSFLHYSGTGASSAPSGSAVGVGPSGTMGNKTGASPGGRSHTAKMALFPLYSEKSTIPTPGISGSERTRTEKITPSNPEKSSAPPTSAGTPGTERMRVEKTVLVPDKKKSKPPFDQEQDDVLREEPKDEDDASAEDNAKDAPENGEDDKKTDN